ncbi:four helix bundle protein [Patescibacteria group bacterium]|nr:four helix bundle protein [Patescibacteria group bacterium]
MTKTQNSKQYDLEDRTYKFAKNCRDFIKQLPKGIAHFEYTKQLIRSSGSQAANYIEANEALSKKDFVHRIKICRKEAKESRLWLKLCEISNKQQSVEKQQNLIQEATELTKIFNAIIAKSK